MKKSFYVIIFLILAFSGILLYNTLTFSTKQIEATPAAMPDIPDAAVERLSKALQFPTVTYHDASLFDSTVFLNFHQFLRESFPKVHENLSVETINKYSLFYRWEGKNPDLKPILLMAHIDVVPSEGEWENGPFSGEIKEGYVYGRGALDVKSGITGILEATEYLLEKNFTPERTICFAFGHDEETGGQQGNLQIARLMEERNIRFEYVLDEGGFIVNDMIPGITQPTAIIGIAEKGYLSIELTSKATGGHSSMPPKRTAIGQLAEAVRKLEQNPFPAEVKGAAEKMFEYAGPEMSFGMKFIFANRFLFNPLIKNELGKSPQSNALMRTTTAPTIFKGGYKDNVLPSEAKAVVNFRILPGESISSVMEYVRKTIDNPDIELYPYPFNAEPSPVSDTESFGFRQIHVSVKETYPNTIVAPYLVIAATDSRHYNNVADQIFRLLPVPLEKEDLKRIHGVNERIGVEQYKKLILFYLRIIENVNGE